MSSGPLFAWRLDNSGTDRPRRPGSDGSVRVAGRAMSSTAATCHGPIRGQGVRGTHARARSGSRLPRATWPVAPKRDGGICLSVRRGSRSELWGSGPDPGPEPGSSSAPSSAPDLNPGSESEPVRRPRGQRRTSPPRKHPRRDRCRTGSARTLRSQRATATEPGRARRASSPPSPHRRRSQFPTSARHGRRPAHHRDGRPR